MREGRSEGGKTFLVVPQMFSMTNGRVLSCGHLSVAIFFLYISQILKKQLLKKDQKMHFNIFKRKREAAAATRQIQSQEIIFILYMMSLT